MSGETKEVLAIRDVAGFLRQALELSTARLEEVASEHPSIVRLKQLELGAAFSETEDRHLRSCEGCATRRATMHESLHPGLFDLVLDLLGVTNDEEREKLSRHLGACGLCRVQREQLGPLVSASDVGRDGAATFVAKLRSAAWAFEVPATSGAPGDPLFHLSPHHLAGFEVKLDERKDGGLDVTVSTNDMTWRSVSCALSGGGPGAFVETKPFSPARPDVLSAEFNVPKESAGPVGRRLAVLSLLASKETSRGGAE